MLVQEEQHVLDVSDGVYPWPGSFLVSLTWAMSLRVATRADRREAGGRLGLFEALRTGNSRSGPRSRLFQAIPNLQVSGWMRYTWDTASVSQPM